ncbi:hypothetical protein EDB19DRAFT_2044309 [Suillus lakei]|nr:hypothetical protein EDB19DRAFT_2044309 [Suillus lakei]
MLKGQCTSRNESMGFEKAICVLLYEADPRYNPLNPARRTLRLWVLAGEHSLWRQNHLSCRTSLPPPSHHSLLRREP